MIDAKSRNRNVSTKTQQIEVKKSQSIGNSLLLCFVLLFCYSKEQVSLRACYHNIDEGHGIQSQHGTLYCNKVVYLLKHGV